MFMFSVEFISGAKYNHRLRLFSCIVLFISCYMNVSQLNMFTLQRGFVCYGGWTEQLLHRVALLSGNLGYFRGSAIHSRLSSVKNSK